MPHSALANINNELDLPSECGLPARKLIAFISKNPLRVMWDPCTYLRGYSIDDLHAALEYFSQDHPDRHVYGVCTKLLHGAVQGLDKKLNEWGMLDQSTSRFWPFWQAPDAAILAGATLDEVGEYLVHLWNTSSIESVAGGNNNGSLSAPQTPFWSSTLMFIQTGNLAIEERQESNGWFFFKCVIPTPPVVNQKKGCPTRKYCGWIVLAYESATRSFYSMNCKIKYDPPEPGYRYIEMIDADLAAPQVADILLSHRSDINNKLRVLVVMDRHIGDNLSLFSTHIKELGCRPDVQLTLNFYRCPFFNTLTKQDLCEMFPFNDDLEVTSLPVDSLSYDFVLDPYDIDAGLFTNKLQNDSGQLSLVSALEFAICYLSEKRRDILEMHQAALRRLGLSPLHEAPEFIEWSFSDSVCNERQIRARQSLFNEQDLSSVSQKARIVSIFPYGLSDKRKYPSHRLRDIIEHLLNEKDVVVVLAGALMNDQAESGGALNGLFRDNHLGRSERIKTFFGRQFSEVIDLMLASEVIISMDSGPLHVARSLRRNPVALYTGKVNNLQEFLAFPWYVEDSTVEVLKPKADDVHVSSADVIAALKNRLQADLTPLS